MTPASIIWAPQPGRQLLGYVSPARVTLYGGARGGGKTQCAIGRQLAGVFQHKGDWNGLMIRRFYKDFKDMRRAWDTLIRNGLPAERIGGENQENYIRFKGAYAGATITLSAVERLEKADDFQGQQYAEISIEEAGTLPFIRRLVTKLRPCLRPATGAMFCRMFLTANPGGPGHQQLKEMFRIEDHRRCCTFTDEHGESWAFIPARVVDNKILLANDPSYERLLKSIDDPVLRAAWYEGRWDVFAGQAFELLPGRQIIQPLEIPHGAPISMTFDWGWSAPFSVGWWWWDGDGRRYRFAEWYGCGDEPNVGLRLSDADVAKGIVEREHKLGIAGRVAVRRAGRDVFGKRPDMFHNIQGPSAAETFASHGLFLSAGDDRDRMAKIRRFRELLSVPRDQNDKPIGLPSMVIYDTCTEFIRTVGTLAMSQVKTEDIDTEQEDHIYDEACHAAMERAIPQATAAAAGDGIMKQFKAGAFFGGDNP